MSKTPPRSALTDPTKTTRNTKAVMPTVVKSANLRPQERDILTAGLIRNLIRPGLIPACKILLGQMIAENDVATAKAIVTLTRDLIQKGFPDGTAKSKAANLLEELGLVSPDVPAEPDEGGPEPLEGDSEEESAEFEEPDASGFEDDDALEIDLAAPGGGEAAGSHNGAAPHHLEPGQT